MPKPWYRRSNDAWYCQHNGRQRLLAIRHFRKGDRWRGLGKTLNDSSIDLAFERERIGSGGMATGGESLEFAPAKVVEDDFRHDAPDGVVSAQEQDIVELVVSHDMRFSTPSYTLVQ